MRGAFYHVNRTKQGVNYRCGAQSRRPECGKAGHSIRAFLLDGPAWSLAVAMLRRPELVTGEPEGFAAEEPNEPNAAALDRELRDVAREEGRIVDAIVTAGDGAAATEVLVHKLGELADRQR